MLTKTITFEPAVDDRNQGQRGVTIRFVISGERGAVEFVLLTSWVLPATPPLSNQALPAPGIGQVLIHNLREDDGESSGPCRYLNDVPCFVAHDATAADVVLDRLLRTGSPGVWAELTRVYIKRLAPTGTEEA